MIMLAHALSTGGLFILVGDMYHRLHTRDLNRMGGLWATAPRMGGVGLFLSLASLGLPGLANFVGEILVLLGVYRATSRWRFWPRRASSSRRSTPSGSCSACSMARM